MKCVVPAFIEYIQVTKKCSISYFTVGSLNGIYGIKSLFPVPMGSATESTGILVIFTKGCFLSEVV